MINTHICKYYTYLILGFLIYIPIFFKLSSNAWLFFLLCLVFNKIWSNYIIRYTIIQFTDGLSENVIKNKLSEDAIRKTIKEAFDEAEQEYRKNKKVEEEYNKKIHDLQKKIRSKKND